MAQRILVIDDEPDLLELVRANLRQAGFEVELGPPRVARPSGACVALRPI